MIYKINSDFIFNSENRTLICLGDSDGSVIELSKYASRALENLVANVGSAVTREKLLSLVWEENESSASNASLNNYISEVRRAFSRVGLDKQLISTIPRYGFKFEGIVEIDEEQQISQLALETQPIKKKPMKAVTRVLITVIIMVLLIIAVVINHSSIGIKTINPVYIYSDNKCNFYSLTSRYDDLKTIEKILRNGGLDCTSRRRDVFYSEGRNYNDTYHTKLISACDRLEDGSYSDCVNIKRVYQK